MPHHERENLIQEKLRIENGIEARLLTQGIRRRSSLRLSERDIAELRTGDGRALLLLLRTELDRLRRRLALSSSRRLIVSALHTRLHGRRGPAR